jgi:hypothetical protein
MKTYVEFRTSAFPPYEDEEDQINPGRYGKRLAEFLALGLKEKGFETLDLVPEDWGWMIPIRNEEFDLWIGCGNYEEYPDEGFLCFIEPHTPIIRRRIFWKIETESKIKALQQAIDQVLDGNASIRDKKWWSREEFNNNAAD